MAVWFHYFFNKVMTFKKTLFFVMLSCVFSFGSPLFAAMPDKNHQAAQFEIITDIHFDPFIACHHTKTLPCPLIQQLRQTNANQWAALFAAYDTQPPQYRQDSNYPLLTSALNASKKTADANHAQFVLVLGDFLGHDFRKYYKKYSQDKSYSGYVAFVKKTLEFLNDELARSFPSLDVYALVGNNDSYQRDYESDPNGPFFADTALLWSSLIKNNHHRTIMKNTFKTGGYYAIDLPNQPNIRLIMLNTVLFSNKAKGKGVDAAANAELDWLHNELESVKANHQKAFIGMHIPPGIDVYATLKLRLFTIVPLWKENYTQRFQSELEQFAPEISAVFAGHLHSDWFQILTFTGTMDEIPVTGTPAISPIFGNNPGFKLYRYAKHSDELLDFTTYYYPLDDQKTWLKEYNFSLLYQPNCHACPIIQGMKTLKPTGNLADHYKQFYAVNTKSQPITTEWNPYYWCAIRKIYTEEYETCVK